MKRFFIRSFIFSIPVLAWAAIVFLVDPFNYFAKSSLIEDRVKLINAKPLNRLMYNMFEEARSPGQNLIIGDSRSNELPLKLIEEITGAEYFLLNSNALKLNESVELYWFANKYRKPEKVYFTINFNMFNRYAYADRVKSVESILDNPLLYIFNRSVAEAIYLVVRGSFQSSPVIDSRPPMNRDEFWDWNIRVKANDHYGKYDYPDTVYQSMREMVNHALKNGIQIVFIIVPHQAEMRMRVVDYNLSAEQARFKKDLFRLGVPVIDYDYDNDITADKGNFSDPIHFNAAIGKLIAREVWGGDLKYGRLLTEKLVDSIPGDAAPDQ